MGIHDEKIRFYEAQEQELQFTEFTSDTAMTLGLAIVAQARALGKPIAVDIFRGGQQLFHFSFDGMSPDNDQWLARKRRCVDRFHMSSAHVGARVANSGLSLEDRYGLSRAEYAAVGGAFPIRIRNVGVVGSIAVTGLPSDEDHGIIIGAIQKYLDR